MRSAATALAMAVGGTSLICYLLMTRLQAATEVVAVTAVAINAAGSADKECILICRNRSS